MFPVHSMRNYFCLQDSVASHVVLEGVSCWIQRHSRLAITRKLGLFVESAFQQACITCPTVRGQFSGMSSLCPADTAAMTVMLSIVLYGLTLGLNSSHMSTPKLQTSLDEENICFVRHSTAIHRTGRASSDYITTHTYTNIALLY